MDVVIWSPSYLNLKSVSQTLNENPLSKPVLLNEFYVRIMDTPVSDESFLRQYTWWVINTRRPQVHVVIIDGNAVTRVTWEMIAQQCACAAQSASCQPMKFVIFYDLNNCVRPPIADYMPMFHHKIQRFIEPLSSFARLHVHLGELPTESGTQIGRTGLVTLAKNIIQLVYHVIGHLND